MIDMKKIRRQEQLLVRWKAALSRLNLNPRQAAEKLSPPVLASTAYMWNSGQRPVPIKRVEQLEALK